MTQNLGITACLLAFSFCLTSCSELPREQAPAEQANALRPHQIFVINHGWHTGMIVPAEPMLAQSAELKQRFPKAQYLEFGWGDQGFYQAEDVTLSLTMQAILWPTPSVVHVAALWAGPSYVFPDVPFRSVCISDAGWQSLQRFLLSSVAHHNQPAWPSLGKGLYGDSEFYRGVGNYHLFHTCNTWIAKALHSAGLPISVPFKLRAASIMDGLDELAEAYSCRSLQSE